MSMERYPYAVSHYMGTDEGKRLVEICRNECINGINDGLGEFEDQGGTCEEVEDHPLFMWVLTSRVILALAKWSDENNTGEK